MNKNRIIIVVSWAATVALAGWAWQAVPEGTRIPVHWDIHGNPNRYGGKTEAFLICPLISVFIIGLMALFARIDPRQEHVEQSREALESIAALTAVFLLVIQGALTWAATGHALDIGKLVLGSIGLFFAGIGHLLSQLRSNRFAGFRTPWTLSSELSWERTHRLGGRMFVVMGLGTAALGLANQTVPAAVWLAAWLVFSLFYTTWYSYRVWKADPDKKQSS